MATQRIAVVRHGEKEKDQNGVEILTPKGKAQIDATSRLLILTKGFSHVDHVLFSGEFRTRQCAEILCTILSYPTNMIMEDDGLHFKAAYASAYNNDFDLFKKDLDKIIEAGNTVAAAREMCKYAQHARGHLNLFIFTLACLMAASGETTAITFSHSPYASLAVPDAVAAKIPYDIGVADVVIYTTEDGAIVDAEHIPCPYQGE
jgi:hypothetical protein